MRSQIYVRSNHSTFKTAEMALDEIMCRCLLLLFHLLIQENERLQMHSRSQKPYNNIQRHARLKQKAKSDTTLYANLIQGIQLLFKYTN